MHLCSCSLCESPFLQTCTFDGGGRIVMVVITTCMPFVCSSFWGCKLLPPPKGYISVSTENDETAVIIDDSEMEDAKNGLETQGCMSVEQNAQVNCDGRYVTQLAYGNEDFLDMEEPDASQVNLSTSRPRLSHSPEQMELVYLRKRRRLAPSFVGMRTKEPEYEDGSVIYEYDPDYECGSVVSEASYTGDQQKTLMDVLNYCQAMYDAIQKLDKKFDSLHRKISEMQHTRLKPLLLKSRPLGFTYRSSSNLSAGKIRVQKPTERRPSQISPPGHRCHSQPTKIRLQRDHILTSSAVMPVPHTLQPELQRPAHRHSPPLPTIVSTHSLCPPFNMTSEMPDISSQTSLATLVNESSTSVASLAIASPVVSTAVSTPLAASLDRNSMTVTFKTSPGSTNILNELPSSSSVCVSQAVASSHSLYLPVSTASEMPDLPSQASLATTAVDNPAHVGSSAVSSQRIAPVMLPEPSLGRNNLIVTYRTPTGNTNISNEMPSSSMSSNFEFIGDPKRNVKVLGNYLMKARQKTRPKYAARYLVRVLFPKETLLCSVMGVRARGRRTLDPNKVAAIREFLATHFPSYDLSEDGRDWKTCITNVNAMIRCLRYETKTSPIIEGKAKAPDTPDTSMCVDLVDNGEESELNSRTNSTSNQLQNSAWDNNIHHPPSSSKLPSLEPMTHLGNPSRNVQLPFSVIYVAKGKSRPELSARYLIRHLFTEDVLVKSNVYGNLERGTYPLDCNKINALRDFLQENYPSFDLKEIGYDWKACVAAINSTIRSLRYDHKRASTGVRSKVLAEPPLLSLSSKCSL
ncbi:BEN domain-containing protein 2 isoform X2 [Rhineura floridana]|uniref:BEN domain-containing protein 2 isoform X2 n=1 Tax=Rhineura floridana TaxID=261503 RepID=UPI002AC8553D|nr:BEN domain-containing protein 2 isoform X2 [Rhineura floridana]